MKTSSIAFYSLIIAFFVPPVAVANDFPTTARVEYVLECMKDHNQDYEYFYKCSCAVDEIAKQVSYDEFNELSTATRYRRLGGERGAVFRDPEMVERMADKYKAAEAKAYGACFMTR
jgi:hypothetical protein